MVRFALISDLHSNLEALGAVFAKIDELGVQEVGCLGDVVGYCADPEICVRMVMERCAWTIMGNHDWGLTNSLDKFNPLAAEALKYTRRRLRPSFLRPRRRAMWKFLTELPERHSAHGFSFVHGSPRDPVMDYVLKSDVFLEVEKMQEIFSLLDGPCFVGHTHWPGAHTADLEFEQAVGDEFEFQLDGSPCVINVGSVGQPRDGDARASFAVVDGAKVVIHRVEYDFRMTQTKILAAGLHPALADRLARGK